MATATSSKQNINGGSFLLEDRHPDEVFTPEDFSDEHLQIARTTEEFAVNEIVPVVDRIEKKEFQVTRDLIRKSSELGLTSIDVPEKYGGMEMDKISSSIVADRIAKSGSFSITFMAHVGIGTLPIAWFGSEEQKCKYLPKLASGEWVGAYALSEGSAGSDALNCRTRATLSSDGKHYLLNGEKMWVTNAAFADVFTIFAKIDGERFTAFIVEKTFPGFTVGPEEHKLGIRGSSTCSVILNDCQVPVENVLGEIGKGHIIAFNVLNVGRSKLGAVCLGCVRTSLQNAIAYAKQRKAFGKTISDFGLIREKVAEMAAKTYALESMVYRTAGMMDAVASQIDKTSPEATLEIRKATEEYTVECSIIKVAGSETLDFAVDETVQIYGGYGFVEDYPAERAYRDSRTNRIFGGTNEINRLIITGCLLKRAMSGQLPLLPAIKKLMDGVLLGPSLAEPLEGPLATESALLASAKKAALFVSGAASQKYNQALADQQEIMAALADIFIEVYAMDSCLVRARKRTLRDGEAAASMLTAMTQVYLAGGIERIEAAAKKVIAAVAEGDMVRTQMAILRRFFKHDPANTIALRQQIAGKLMEAGKYVVS